MSYNSNVYNTLDDVKILQQRIQDNFAELLKKFASSSPPVGSGVPSGLQWWANTSDDKLYIRNKNDNEWLPLMNILEGGVFIKAGQVGTAEISDTARKGTIVQGEDISPSTCSIKAHPVITSFPTDTEQSSPKTFGNYPTWETLVRAKVYIPFGISTLHMVVRLKPASLTPPGVKAKFLFDSISSTETNYIVGTTSYQWTMDEEAILDVSGISGWGDLEIQGLGSLNLAGSMAGYSFRSDDAI